jgi:hypothetical protein
MVAMYEPDGMAFGGGSAPWGRKLAVALGQVTAVVGGPGATVVVEAATDRAWTASRLALPVGDEQAAATTAITMAAVTTTRWLIGTR